MSLCAMSKPPPDLFFIFRQLFTSKFDVKMPFRFSPTDSWSAVKVFLLLSVLIVFYHLLCDALWRTVFVLLYYLIVLVMCDMRLRQNKLNKNK